MCRVQGNSGFWPIQCNPANDGVGWPYPAKAAIHFRNVLFLPGRTAAAHLYGLIGFGEKFSLCLFCSGTNTLATQEHYESDTSKLNHCITVIIYTIPRSLLNIQVVDMRTLQITLFYTAVESKV